MGVSHTYLHISHINISLQRFDLSPLRRLPGTPRAVGTFHGAFVDWTEGQLESGRNPSRDPRWMIRDVWRYKIISYVYIANDDMIESNYISGKELFCDDGLWTLWTFIILCCASPKLTFTSTNSTTHCTTHWQPWDFAPADLKSACFIDAWNMNFQGTGPPYPETLSWRARWLSLLVHLQLVELTAQQKNKQWTWQGSTEISNVAMSMQQYRISVQ